MRKPRHGMRHPEFNPNLSTPQFVSFSIYTNLTLSGFCKSQKILMLSLNTVWLETSIYYENQLGNIIKNQLFHSSHWFVQSTHMCAPLLRPTYHVEGLGWRDSKASGPCPEGAQNLVRGRAVTSQLQHSMTRCNLGGWRDPLSLGHLWRPRRGWAWFWRDEGRAEKNRHKGRGRGVHGVPGGKTRAVRL